MDLCFFQQFRASVIQQHELYCASNFSRIRNWLPLAHAQHPTHFAQLTELTYCKWKICWFLYFHSIRWPCADQLNFFVCRHFHRWSNNGNCNYDHSTYICLCPPRCHRIRWRCYSGCYHMLTSDLRLSCLHISRRSSFSRQFLSFFSQINKRIFKILIPAPLGMNPRNTRKPRKKKSNQLSSADLNLFDVRELLTRALLEIDWTRRLTEMQTEAPSTDRVRSEFFFR